MKADPKDDPETAAFVKGLIWGAPIAVFLWGCIILATVKFLG